MTHKPAVHVFLGAPPSTVGDPVVATSPWETRTLTWLQGKLRPPEEHDEGGPRLDAASDDDATPSLSPERVRPCAGMVAKYLDSCFPPTLTSRSGPEPPAVSPMTDYLTTWTKSQDLFLKAGVREERSAPGTPASPPKPAASTSVDSPELYSPEYSAGGTGGTLQNSAGFYDNLSQWHQEGGVVLAQTPDGILCSQDTPVEPWEPCGETSPTPCTSKRLRGTNQGSVQRATPVLDGPTTLLSRCGRHGVSYSVLVAVLHPCHLKEIKVKTGASAGTGVALATVIVTDQSGVEMKVVMWRAAAFWALTVHPGDIALITGLSVHLDKWRGENVLQSSHRSRLLNLGQISRNAVLQAPQSVSPHTLRALCDYLYEKRPLLTALPHRTPQDFNSIPFARLGALRPDAIVHALLRVRHCRMVSAWRDETEGVSRTGCVPKAVLTVEQSDFRQGAVVLWGAALMWLQRIQENKGAVWEFRMLLVKQDVTSDLLELHSTPWSTCRLLPPRDPRYKELCTAVGPHRSAGGFEIDLHTLLSQKYTGDVELTVHITRFQFQSSASQNALEPLDGETPTERVLDVVCGDITFTGCGLCCAELDTDENGIYRPCYPCLPHTGVRRYYRPVVLTVREGRSQICVHAPPTLVQKILLDTPPDKLHKSAAPESEETFAHVVAKRIHRLLAPPPPAVRLLVHSHFECDENGVPIIKSFVLRDVT